MHNTSEPLGKELPKWSTNVTTFTHSWPHEEELFGTRCDALTFFVTASSDIGESAVGNVSSGFHIRKLQMAVRMITVTITPGKRK